MSDWDNFVTITNTPLGFLLFGIIIFGLLIIIFGLLRKKPHKGMIGGDGDINWGIFFMVILLVFVIFIILGEVVKIKGLTFVKPGGAN